MARTLLIALVLVALAPVAAAHGDALVADVAQVLTLEPGASRAFDLRVHYHRVFGEVDAGAHPVRLVLRADEGGAPGAIAWDSGIVTGRHAFNVHSDCCDRIGWAPYHLVVTNEGASVAHVRLFAKTAHDDVLVGFAALEGPIEMVAILTIPTAVFAWRVARAKPRGDTDGARLLRASVAAMWAPILLVMAVGAWGAARWGGGTMAGAVAAFAWAIPTFGNVVLGLLVLSGIATAAAFWARARRAPSTRPRALLATSALLAASLLALPLMLTAAYGARVLPLSLLGAVPLASVLLWGGARPVA